MKELIEYINNNELYRQAANIKLYYIGEPCNGAFNCAQIKTGFWSLKKGNFFESIFSKNKLVELSKKYIENQKEDSNFIDGLMNSIKEKSDLLELFYEKVSKKDIQKLNLNEVQKLLKEIDVLNYDYWTKAFLCDIFDPKGETLLSDEIKKEGVNLSEDELNIFLRTKKLNYFQKEKFELINIFQKPFNEQDALLEEHAKKYFFIDNSWESTKVLTKNDFRKKLEELKVENVETDLVDLRTNWEKEQEKLQEKHSISDKLMNIFYFFKQLFILRDERKMMTLQSNHYYDLLVLRLSEIIGYPFEKLSCLKIEDLTGNISIDSINDAIEKKKDLFIDYYAKGVFGSLYGNEAKEVYEVFHKTLDVGKTIKGNVASKGIVEGIVRVIVGEVHFSKFNDDEILVAPMTRPEYLPLMKKAKAIITDEGGITCHAAIISRELKIPCIIGTQVATKVLKDGDLVEVNAETGVVKILK